MTMWWVAVLLAGFLATPSLAQEAPLTGEQVFKQRCSICHSIRAVPGKVAKPGPHLAGIVGRVSGSATFAYSPALKASKLTWTKPNLDRYLTAPTKMVAGTSMIIALSETKQRRAVIDYLATLQ